MNLHRSLVILFILTAYCGCVKEDPTPTNNTNNNSTQKRVVITKEYEFSASDSIDLSLFIDSLTVRAIVIGGGGGGASGGVPVSAAEDTSFGGGGGGGSGQLIDTVFSYKKGAKLYVNIGVGGLNGDYMRDKTNPHGRAGESTSIFWEKTNNLLIQSLGGDGGKSPAAGASVGGAGGKLFVSGSNGNKGIKKPADGGTGGTGGKHPSHNAGKGGNGGTGGGFTAQYKVIFPYAGIVGQAGYAKIIVTGIQLK